MLYVGDPPRSDDPLSSNLECVRQSFTAALVPDTPTERESAEVRYFEERARRELELAAAATHPKAEAIHLELVHAYRQRARQARPLPEIFSWVDEGGTYLPYD